MKREFLLKKRGNVWYYRLAHEITFHSTGQKTKVAAQRFVIELLKESKEAKVRVKYTSPTAVYQGLFYLGEMPPCPEAY